MKILFVCIGNTCRSPMAEAVMQNLINKHQLDWQTDSAGLRAWNVGISPEKRCLKVLSEHGLSTDHLGRMINASDFQHHDYIFGMDTMNIHELQELAIKFGMQPHCSIELLGSYLGRKEDEIISDPYFSEGIGAFRTVYAQIRESCEKFIQQHK